MGYAYKYDVTIAMPVYNAEQYLNESIGSVCRQTWMERIELLILDDCCTDHSIERIKEMAHKHGLTLSIFRAKQNSGVGVMRNKAIELAQGKYLFYLDSDDIITPDCIETFLRHAQDYDAELIIGSHCDVRGESETFKKEKDLIFEKPNEFAQYAFLNRGGYAGGVWNKMIKVELLRREKIIFPEFRVGEDIPFIFLLLTKVIRVITISNVTYKYIIHPGSLCQYNPRTIIPREETETHIASKYLLKKILADNREKPYYMPMLSMVMGYCIDTARVLIEKKNVTEVQVEKSIMKDIMTYPVSFNSICQYGNKQHIFLFILSKMPYKIIECYFLLRKKIKDIGAYSGDSRSPIPMISVHSVGYLLYRRQS